MDGKGNLGMQQKSSLDVRNCDAEGGTLGDAA